tara:strand:- start:11874 stop:12341 length:468 start_codon:yes stop_codon:yes gene_type:complete
MSKFYSTKTYGNDRGLSCAFRQWRATHSHCSLIHGYSLGFKLVFECESLDERNWVMDFGGLKKFKNWLEDMFDHKLVIAKDDPKLEELKKLEEQGLAEIRIVNSVGAERFAEMAWHKMAEILIQQVEDNSSLNPTVKVKSVECFEHGANSAIFEM